MAQGGSRYGTRGRDEDSGSGRDLGGLHGGGPDARKAPATLCPEYLLLTPSRFYGPPRILVKL